MIDVVRAIFKCNRKNEDRIQILAELLEPNGPIVYDTGAPGAVCSEEEIGGGVIVRRNGNGTIVEVEVPG